MRNKNILIWENVLIPGKCVLFVVSFSLRSCCYHVVKRHERDWTRCTRHVNHEIGISLSVCDTGGSWQQSKAQAEATWLSLPVQDRGQMTRKALCWWSCGWVNTSPSSPPSAHQTHPLSYLCFTSNHLPRVQQSRRHGNRCPVSKTGIMFLEEHSWW